MVLKHASMVQASARWRTSSPASKSKRYFRSMWARMKVESATRSPASSM